MPIETTNSGLPPAPPRGDVDHLRQHPAFQEGRLRLAEALRRAWDLAKQAALTAPQQELSRQLESQTGDLRLPATLQRKGVQQHFGNRSEKLAAAFGLRPIRGRKSSSNRIAPPATAPPCPPG